LKPSRASLLALTWGFAEATFFFIVPDVLLTYLALKEPRTALRASLAALAGALAGGAAMYAWGSQSPDTARVFLIHVPAIHESTLARVDLQLEARGLPALFLGPLGGIPYKIYAVEWGQRHGAMAGFLLTSVPARYLRFLAAVVVASLLRRFVRAWLWATAWVIFYVFYFWRLGW